VFGNCAYFFTELGLEVGVGGEFIEHPLIGPLACGEIEIEVRGRSAYSRNCGDGLVAGRYDGAHLRYGLFFIHWECRGCVVFY